MYEQLASEFREESRKNVSKQTVSRIFKESVYNGDIRVTINKP